MSRAVPEWIAKSDDEKIPNLVKLRIWARCNGRCHISGRKIMPGDSYDFEHVIALCNGGQHRESNISLALAAPHKEKTKDDLKLKAKITRIRKRHLGFKKAGRTMPGRKFDGTPIFSRARS